MLNLWNRRKRLLESRVTDRINCQTTLINLTPSLFLAWLATIEKTNFLKFIYGELTICKPL